MKRLVYLVLTIALTMAFAVNAGAATVSWDGITWGVDNNSVAVDGSGNLVMTGVDARGWESYNGYGALVGVYPYGGYGTGQSHATWDPGTFQQEWFQTTFIDAGDGAGAAPYIMVEENVPYRGLYIASQGVGSTDVRYTGSPDGGTSWYEDSLYSRTAGTHTLAMVLNASDKSIDAYYDGNLTASFSSGFDDLEHIYLGSFGASGQTLTYTDFQVGTNSLPPSVVPEPGTLTLLGLAGLFGLAMAWIRRRQSSG